MSENDKPIEDAAHLNDADLTDVAGGVETKHIRAALCPKCGGGPTEMLSPFTPSHFKCKLCGNVFFVWGDDVQELEYDLTTDDGKEFHTVSGEF